jgi:hypothetical protein
MEITTFQAALKILGLGMTGILVFMLMFGLIIICLKKLFPVKDK